MLVGVLVGVFVTDDVGVFVGVFVDVGVLVAVDDGDAVGVAPVTVTLPFVIETGGSPSFHRNAGWRTPVGPV